MTPFEAYQLYIALKNHFSLDSYDYFKYQGRTNAKQSTLDRRNDKWFFHRLAKRKNLFDFLLANIVENENTWVGDLEGKFSDDVYVKWAKTKESLSYVFSQDLKKMLPDFDKNFHVEDRQFPHLLNLYLQQEITFETFTILLHMVGCAKYWSFNMADKTMWPQIRRKAEKYLPFIKYDHDKMKNLIVKQFRK